MPMKFRTMVEGVQNPFLEIVSLAVLYGNKAKKKDLERYIDSANAAWDAACDWLKHFPHLPIEFEASTVEQNLKFVSVKPYVQLKCGTSRYRIYVKNTLPNFSYLQKVFGGFYVTDIRDIVEMWINKNYTGSLIPDKKETKSAETESVAAETESGAETTGLFVISKGDVYGVDSGKWVWQEPLLGNESKFIFTCKLCKRDNPQSRLDLEFADRNYEGLKVTVTEYDTYEKRDVESVSECEVRYINESDLKELEMLYREGRSKLPDTVFDDIMEAIGVSEEKLHELCGEIDNSNKVSSGYPAENKILSLEKVRDENKTEDIVRNWKGKAVVSWKLDGCAVRLHYKGVNFVRAETKGKSRDVTGLMKNVAECGEFPLQIKSKVKPFGERWFEYKEWFVTGELVAKNASRSKAAGYLLRKDVNSEETKRIASELEFIVYDSNICEIYPENDRPEITQYSQMLELLSYIQKVGDFNKFKVVTTDEFVDINTTLQRLDPPKDIDTDGLVIRVNDLARYKSLGETSHHPKGGVAFKFEDEWKVVEPKRIYGNRGVNNVLKIIAEFDPVKFGDKTVTSAVWQPKNSADFYLGNYVGCDKREVFYGQYGRGKKFTEYFNVGTIEVCLRGHVIPQWRLVRGE